MVPGTASTCLQKAVHAAAAKQPCKTGLMCFAASVGALSVHGLGLTDRPAAVWHGTGLTGVSFASGNGEGKQRPAPSMGGTNPGEGHHVKENRMQRGDSGRKKVMDALKVSYWSAPSCHPACHLAPAVEACASDRPLRCEAFSVWTSLPEMTWSPQPAPLIDVHVHTCLPRW